MFEGSSIAGRQCQPMVAYSGRGASLHLSPENLSQFHHLKFSKVDSIFSYDISICRIKKHRRYVLDLEHDTACSFEDFTIKVELWKKDVGIK